MYSITRDNFNEDNAVEKKVFQKLTKLVDSDINEQIDIELNRYRRVLSALIGHADKRFVNGFKVEGTGTSLQVTIKAGFGAFHTENQKAILLRLAEDFTLIGFTAWSANRTDYIYIDIWEDEVGVAEDVNIVNPDVGEVTCVDQRANYTFNISEGAVPGAPPLNHIYVTLATVTKTTGSNIEAGDVLVQVESYFTLADGSVTTVKIADDAITNLKMADNAIGSNELINDSITNLKMANNSVNTNEIIDNAVTKDKINLDVVGIGLSQAVDGSLDVEGVKDSGVIIKTRVLQIGDWDMTVVGPKNVAHGLNLSKIRDVKVVVIDDASTSYYPLNFNEIEINITSGDYVAGSTNITMNRASGGKFNNSNYNQLSFNRGWITIIYEA